MNLPKDSWIGDDEEMEAQRLDDLAETRTGLNACVVFPCLPLDNNHGTA